MLHRVGTVGIREWVSACQSEEKDDNGTRKDTYKGEEVESWEWGQRLERLRRPPVQYGE